MDKFIKNCSPISRQRSSFYEHVAVEFHFTYIHVLYMCVCVGLHNLKIKGFCCQKSKPEILSLRGQGLFHLAKALALEKFTATVLLHINVYIIGGLQFLLLQLSLHNVRILFICSLL